MPVSIRRAAEAVKSVFGEHDWSYSYDAELNQFTTKFNLTKTDLGSADILIRLRPSNADPAKCRAILAYGLIHLRADATNMAQICEYLTRVNLGLGIGNFELDHRDGEIRYKVSINCRSAMPGDSALEDLVAIPVAMYNRYGNGLIAVSKGTMSAEDAAKEADAN